MTDKGNSIPEFVRVSVLFKSPTKLNRSGETSASRYKRIIRDTDEKRTALLSWLERNHITYSRVTTLEAFSTVTLDVPLDAVARLKTAPGVLEVDEETPIPFEPI